MSPGAILIGLALVVMIVPLIAEPFLPRNGIRRAAPGGTAAEPFRSTPGIRSRPRQKAEEDYAAALRALRELDFDLQTEKISVEDHGQLRADLLQQAAHALQALDAPPAEDSRDEEIEQAVRRLRRGKQGLSPSGGCQSCGTQLMPDDHFCPHCGESTRVCQSCGAAYAPGEAYCSCCGIPVQGVPATLRQPEPGVRGVVEG